jgi:hypothetical protein
MFGLLYVFAAAVLLFRIMQSSVHMYQVPEDELQLQQQVGTSQISSLQ